MTRRELVHYIRPNPQAAGIGMTAALSAIGAKPSEGEPRDAKYV